MIGIFVVALCLLQVVQVFGAGTLPNYIKKCKRDDSLNACLKENVDICRPHLAEGIPQLSIPKMSPLTIPKVTLESKDYTFELTEFILDGLGDFELKDISFVIGDIVDIHLEMDFPKLITDANYSLKGKVLMLELNGKGKSSANATNINVNIDLKGKTVTKKGADQIQVDGGKVTLQWNGKISVYFGNLFGDRQDVTDATNQVINDNIMDFTKELQPILENVILSVVMGILKPITNKFTLKELFD